VRLRETAWKPFQDENHDNNAWDKPGGDSKDGSDEKPNAPLILSFLVGIVAS